MTEEPRKGDLWKNNRNGLLYYIVAVPLWSDTPGHHEDEGLDGLEPWVTAQSVETGVDFTRSMKSFMGANRHGQPRFELIRRKP